MKLSAKHQEAARRVLRELRAARAEGKTPRLLVLLLPALLLQLLWGRRYLIGGLGMRV